MGSESNSTIFSADGRLLQLEYALKASEQGSNITFNVFEDNVIVARERRNDNKLMEDDNFIHKIADNKYLLFSGLVPDSFVIKKAAITILGQYKKSTSEEMTTSQLVKELSNFIQFATLSGKRPYGVQVLVAGFEDKPQCYIIEADSNFSEYFAGSIGRKKEKVISYLEKSEIYEDISIKAIQNVIEDDIQRIDSYRITRTEILQLK